MRTVLAFDQAFRVSGYAVGSTDKGIFACGRILVSPRRFDSLGSRFLRFEKAVLELLGTYKPRLCVLEEHRSHKGIQAAQVLGAVTAIILKCCEEAGIDYISVPVATLKKAGSGSHNASKALMVATARKKHPHLDIVDDNVADAVHLCAYGLVMFSPKKT